MKFVLSTLTLIVLTFSRLSAALFESGDQWCAVGDSITHGGEYHRHVLLFNATRSPGTQVHFHNCGISGDTAAGTLRRFEWDILRHKPTVVSLMLGMNDVTRNLYTAEPPSPEQLDKREAALNAYFKNMRELAGKLQATGARLFFMTPSIYDETAAISSNNNPGVNGALGKCAEYVRSLASEFKGKVVDFHAPMAALNVQQQAANPAYSIVGADRIHPGAIGHFVMAYHLLKAMGAPQIVSTIEQDARGERSLTFERLEDALPFPVANECKDALKLVPFMEELNQQRLRIISLPPGSYQLSIDGEPIATFSAEALAQGINLAEYPHTPQYRQAVAVAALDERRHQLQKQLRTIEYCEITLGRPSGDESPFDYQAAVERVANRPNVNPWVKNTFLSYLKIKPDQQTLKQKLQDNTAQIAVAATPKPHSFSLEPAAP